MIAIDIPMPESCCVCPCFDGVENLCGVYPFIDDVKQWNLKERHPRCPLLAVEHVRDKTELSLWEVEQAKNPKSKEELDKAINALHSNRLGAFIFDHPELIRCDYSDDYDAYLRYYATDCYVVKINKEEKQ